LHQLDFFFPVTSAVSSWWGENSYFFYNNNTCQAGQVCGHYTQVAWNTSIYLGCAIYQCNNVAYPYTILCDYGPGGNSGGLPYTQCPNGVCPTCYGLQVSDSKVCSGNGTCAGLNTCYCYPGYSGDQCQSLTSCGGKLSSDPTVCSGNGICVNQNNCKCTAGWSGSNCDVTTCNGILSNNAAVCGGAGNCIGLNNCKCSPNYTGQFCQISNSNFATKSQLFLFNFFIFNTLLMIL